VLFAIIGFLKRDDDGSGKMTRDDLTSTRPCSGLPPGCSLRALKDQDVQSLSIPAPRVSLPRFHH